MKLTTLLTTLLLSLTSLTNAEENIVEQHFHEKHVFADATVLAPSGVKIKYIWRKDGTLQQVIHPKLTVNYDNKGNVVSGTYDGMVFKDLTIKDKNKNIDLQYKMTESNDKVTIHYWGTLYGKKVDETYTKSEERRLINDDITSNFAALIVNGEAAKKIAKQIVYDEFGIESE